MNTQPELDFTPRKSAVSDEQRRAAADKIRKLLAMRRGGTQSEIETAQALAEAIALKNGIDIDDVAEDEHGRPREIIITHRILGEWGKRPPEAMYSALICKNFFNVAAFASCGYTERQIFVGTDWDLDIAAYAFNCVLNEFRNAWNKRRGRCRKRSVFMHGCYSGLFLKLRERFPRVMRYEPEANAVIVSIEAKRQQYIDENFGKLVVTPIKARATNSAAAGRGFMAGQEIEIRPGVKGAPQSRPDLINGPRAGRLLTN